MQLHVYTLWGIKRKPPERPRCPLWSYQAGKLPLDYYGPSQFFKTYIVKEQCLVFCFQPFMKSSSEMQKVYWSRICKLFNSGFFSVIVEMSKMGSQTFLTFLFSFPLFPYFGLGNSGRCPTDPLLQKLSERVAGQRLLWSIGLAGREGVLQQNVVTHFWFCFWVVLPLDDYLNFPVFL